MTTQAQRWAQKRNWHKARLISAQSVCRNLVLIKEESILLEEALKNIKKVLSLWERNNKKSKKKYLRIKL